MQEKTKQRYQVIAAQGCEEMAKELESKYPERFHFHRTSWGKFPVGVLRWQWHREEGGDSG